MLGGLGQQPLRLGRVRGAAGAAGGGARPATAKIDLFCEGRRGGRPPPPPLDDVRFGRVGLGRHILAHARAVAAAVAASNVDAASKAASDFRADAASDASSDLRADAHADAASDLRAVAASDASSDARADARADCNDRPDAPTFVDGKAN